MFFPLFSKVFTNILKIYELTKIFNAIPKYCQALVTTIIMYGELRQSEFSVSSGRVIIKLSKICFLGTYTDQMIIQQNFLLQIQFYNIFTNALSIIFKSFY